MIFLRLRNWTQLLKPRLLYLTGILQFALKTYLSFKRGNFLRLLLGVERKDQYKKVLCQICANLIGTSWHLVTQHATSVTVSIIKIRVNKLCPCFGSRGSEVQILSPRPLKTMGYGLGLSAFFVVASTGASIWYSVGNKWRANWIKSSPLPVIS